MFALIDGNNFYASCEQIFDPKLRGRPLVVASNNDGCAIARSDEAKALGIKMGQPLFEIRRLFPKAGVVMLSANFTLYGSMSDRMMSIAAPFGTKSEPYSIDELFLEMDGVPGNLTRRGHQMRRRIEQWIGLPTGIGVGRTKTLAKLANHVAKSAYRKPGSYPIELARVCDLAALPASDFEAVLAATDLNEIWGIGRRIGAQLQAAGLKSALDVVRLDPATVRRRWSVVLERTVRELQGQSCIAFEDVPPAKKEIACTRSFGHTVTDLAPLIEAVTEFASRAAEKLRQQGGLAGQVQVFVHTSAFRDDKQFARSATMPLRRPTADTGLIAQAALRGLEGIYRKGFNIAKAGVMLLDIQDGNGSQQQDLDLDGPENDRSELMRVMDKLNMRYGRGTIQLASAGTGGSSREWAMKQVNKTPAFTTDWTQLPICRT